MFIVHSLEQSPVYWDFVLYKSWCVEQYFSPLLFQMKDIALLQQVMGPERFAVQLWLWIGFLQFGSTQRLTKLCWRGRKAAKATLWPLRWPQAYWHLNWQKDGWSQHVVNKQVEFVELDDMEVPDKASSVGERAVGPGRGNRGTSGRSNCLANSGL